MIASENFTSPAVLEAQGSVLTNKYAEGYPSQALLRRLRVRRCRRNSGDQTRAKKLFGAEHANVQPHAGSQANAGVYLAMLQPGDTILGMDLASGGHLTHGHKMSFSGKIYNAVKPTVSTAKPNSSTTIEVRDLALEHRPKMLIAGFSAYPRVIDWAKFRAIADEVGAYFHGRYGARRRFGGDRRISFARPARRLRYHDDA